MMRIALAALIAVSAMTLAGCSAGTPTVTPTKASFTFGASAAGIATAVKACTDVAEGNAGSAQGVASYATCVINGKTVDFYSWVSASDQHSPDKTFDGYGTELYYAAAPGWTAVCEQDGDLPGQQAVAAAVVASLSGETYHQLK